jgi:hypothetical protein
LRSADEPPGLDACPVAKAGVRQRACATHTPDPVAKCESGQSERRIGIVIVAQALTKSACFQKVTGGWVSKGPVRVNGVTLTFKDREGKLTIEEEGAHLYTTGAFNVSAGSLTWPSPQIDVRVPTTKPPPGEPLKAKGVFKRDAKSTSKAFGFTLAGGVDSDFSSENGGQAKLTLHLELPEIFTVTKGKGTSERKGESQGISVDFAVTVSNGKAPSYAGGFTINRAFVLRLFELNNVSVHFDSDDETFEGKATVALPVQTKLRAPTVGLTIGLANGKLNKFELGAEGIDKPLSPLFFLQSLKVSLGGISPAANGDSAVNVTGSGKVSFGPKLPIPKFLWQPDYMGEINASVKLAADPTPSVTVAGDGVVAGQKLGAAEVKLQTGSGDVSFKGELGLNLFGYGLFGTFPESYFKVNGTFEFRGYGNIAFPGIGRGSGSIYWSQKGAAGCAGDESNNPAGPRAARPSTKRFGAYYEYRTNKWLKFDSSCDLGKLELQLRRSRRASAAQADAPAGFTLPTGLDLASVAVRGVGAPPKVTLTGPGGDKIVTPADESGIQTNSVTLVQDPSDSTTYIVLTDPAGGDWTVDPHSGSAPIAAVFTAQGLPAPKVKASVRGRGATRTLSYQVNQIPGQRITFAEAGDTGATIGTASRKRGKIRFRPALGTVGGKRRVVAVVNQDGRVRTMLDVATYKVPAPRAPAKPRKLRLRRAAGKVQVSWARARLAREYLVHARLSDGRTLVRETRSRRFTASGLTRTTTGTLLVYAIGSDGRESKPARGVVRRFKARGR